MDRVECRRRIFESFRGLQIATREEVLDAGKAVRGRCLHGNWRSCRAIAAESAAIFHARCQGSPAPAVYAGFAAIVEDVGPGGDVDEADRAQAKLGWQRARYQRNIADQTGSQNAAETGDA